MERRCASKGRVTQRKWKRKYDGKRKKMEEEKGL